MPTYAPSGQTNVKAIQLHCLFTEVYVTLNMYRHDAKHGN